MQEKYGTTERPGMLFRLGHWCARRRLTVLLVWLVVLIVAVVLTVPDVPVAPLLIISAVVLIGVPLWFYPRSKMIWAAVEYLVLRGEPEYRPPVARDARQRELE